MKKRGRSPERMQGETGDIQRSEEREGFISTTLRRMYPDRSIRVQMPENADHWHQAAAAFMGVGTVINERMEYARKCAGISVEVLASKLPHELRSLKRYLSGKRQPAASARFFVDYAKKLRVDPFWLEYGVARQGGRYIGPPWLMDAVHAVGIVAGGGQLSSGHKHHGEEDSARAALGKVRATPVLIPVLIGDLTAVQSVVCPEGAELLLRARTSGGIYGPDEVARYALRRGR